MDIASGIAAATHGLGIAKTLREIEKSYDQATLKAQLADLMSTLADAKLALIEAKESMAEKDKEIAALRTNFAVQAELIVSDGDYKFFAGESGNPLGYPVCPKCELDGKIVQLKQNGGIVQARCPSCMIEYQPVTCFLPPEEGDATLRSKQEGLRSEQSARSSAALRRHGSRNSWMG